MSLLEQLDDRRNSDVFKTLGIKILTRFQTKSAGESPSAFLRNSLSNFGLEFLPRPATLAPLTPSGLAAQYTSGEEPMSDFICVFLPLYRASLWRGLTS